MKVKDKELLLKDLCARLPYHVRCKIWLKDGTTEEGLLDLEHNYGNVLQDAFYYNKIKDIKPYLRPMSSMTDAEKKELWELLKKLGIISDVKRLDWFVAHHFDIRNLIENGLALEAPEEMYDLNKD